jgi:hypothetical protein
VLDDLTKSASTIVGALFVKYVILSSGVNSFMKTKRFQAVHELKQSDEACGLGAWERPQILRNC